MHRVAKRKTQTERRQESERSLLTAAMEVIAKHGVAAVTFDAVGQLSGLSRGLATQRFGSKAKMIEALLSDLHVRQDAVIQAYRLDNLPGLEAVLSYVNQVLGDLVLKSESRVYFMLLSSSVGDANDLRPAFRDTHQAVETRLKGWVAKGQQDGTIRSNLDAGSIATMIGCLIFGTSMQLLVDPTMDIEPMRKTSLATLGLTLSPNPSTLIFLN